MEKNVTETDKEGHRASRAAKIYQCYQIEIKINTYVSMYLCMNDGQLYRISIGLSRWMKII